MSSTTDVLNFKQYVHPLKSAINYVSLLNSSNDLTLSCCLFVLFISGLWILWYIFRRLSSPLTHMHQLLYEAISEGDNIKAIRIIKKYPATINMFYTKEGYTPFLKACMVGNTLLVKYMIVSGADLNVNSYKNETPFYLAIYNHLKNPGSKDASCIHALYYAGVDINVVNEKGYNALQLACSYGHTSLMKWLMEKGANFEVLPDPYVLARVQGYMNTALVFKNLKCKFNKK